MLFTGPKQSVPWMCWPEQELVVEWTCWGASQAIPSLPEWWKGDLPWDKASEPGR